MATSLFKSLPVNGDNKKPLKELGGEIITIGSDAHTTKDVGAEYDKARELLKETGFKYFTTFTNRKPDFKKL